MTIIRNFSYNQNPLDLIHCISILGTQTEYRTRDAYIQVNDSFLSELLPVSRAVSALSTNLSPEASPERMSSSDSNEWIPNESSASEEEEYVESTNTTPVRWNERKFLVFESCLMQLFAICSFCLAPVISIKKRLFGSMLQIHAECLNGHETKWMSQPLHNQMALGNLFIAASCLFSGSQCSKLLCFFHHLNMPSIAIRTYSDIQRAYLIPTVNAIWAKCQQELFMAMKNMQLVLGGDARMDSPGHSEKYGSYSVMDLGTNKVIDLQLVQVAIPVNYTYCLLYSKL